MVWYPRKNKTAYSKYAKGRWSKAKPAQWSKYRKPYAQRRLTAFGNKNDNQWNQVFRLTTTGLQSGGTGLIAANQLNTRIFGLAVGNQIPLVKEFIVSSSKFREEVSRFAHIRIKGLCVRRQIFGVAGTPDQSSIRFVWSWDLKSPWAPATIDSTTLFAGLLEQPNVRTMNVATSSGTGFEPRYPEIRSYCYNPAPKWFDPKSTTISTDTNVLDFTPCWYIGA